jgi:hypothetical protein
MQRQASNIEVSIRALLRVGLLACQMMNDG